MPIVTGTQEAVSKAGVDSEMAYQLEKLMKEFSVEQVENIQKLAQAFSLDEIRSLMKGFLLALPQIKKTVVATLPVELAILEVFQKD